jgi:hypothetical protein
MQLLWCMELSRSIPLLLHVVQAWPTSGSRMETDDRDATNATWSLWVACGQLIRFAVQFHGWFCNEIMCGRKKFVRNS